MSDSHALLMQQLEALVTHARRRKLLQLSSNALPWALALFGALLLWSQSLALSLVAGLALFSVSVIFATRSGSYKNIQLANLLLHFNRQFPQLEESAQLLLVTKPVSLLQQLQKQTTEQHIQQLLQQKHNLLLPKYPFNKGLIASLIIGVSAVAIWQYALPLLSTGLPADQTSGSAPAAIAKPVTLVNSKVTVAAPAYTKRALQTFKQLDINLLSDSVVSWQLNFSDPQKSYAIRFSDGSSRVLATQDDGSVKVEKVINSSVIYHFTADNQPLPGIYTLSVTADSRPNIRILTPQTNITEIAKDAVAELTTEVRITDDHAVGKVEIMASIAKGSGEAVKFRDQLFQFDSQTLVEGKTHYFKKWRLNELDMEPGDELYFSVRAWDNRAPQPQLSRSATMIIRWLEDEQQGVLSDGILIDFMPEYFKSQRQIIIETEQLIADRSQLDSATFAETSQALGNAQSDLKEKYGQYLGDEVDDGSGGHTMEDGAVFVPQDEHDNDTHAEAGHEEEHHEEAGPSGITDRSGFSQIIEQFGHAHGDADIGIIAKQNPVGLMKRAIAAMWEAELHLMLAAPEKALPYENEALQFLNRAKKAERIYVKRLGFEPPPVTESRRYQGDLSDILSYQQSEEIAETEAIEDSISLLLTQINSHSGENLDNPLPERTKKLISAIQAHLNTLVQQRPDMIKYVAILQRLQQANSLNLSDCEDCLQQLTQALWRLLPEPVAKPIPRREAYLNQQQSIKAYAEFLPQSPRSQQ